MDEPQPAITRWQRWLFAASASTALCALWFAYLNRHGCQLFRSGDIAWIVFAFPWLWLALLFGLKKSARLRLLLITAIVGVIGFLSWPHVTPGGESAQESSAVGRLRTYREGLEKYQSEHRSYPAALPPVETGRVDKFYTFTYLPTRSSDGAVTSYMVQATSKRPECYCETSFVIDQEGRIYHTHERRPATPNDPSIDIIHP